MAGIFICYRRTDAEGWAGRLSDSLRAELGRIKIFRDIEDIPPGVEFDSYINEAVGSCDVLIALIGPQWLTVTDKNGLRRLDDPQDFTRLEIVTALARNVRVIPALVGGAQIPDIDELPDDLKPLARRQAYELSDSRWVDDCRKLAEVLTPIVKHHGSLKAKVAAIILVAILMGGVGYGAKLWYDYREAVAREKAEQERIAQEKAQRQLAAEEDARRHAEEAAQARAAEEARRQAEKEAQAREAEDARRRAKEAAKAAAAEEDARRRAEEKALKQSEAIQAQYVQSRSAKRCSENQAIVSRIKVYIGSTLPVPERFRGTILFPSRKAMPTISDLAIDRITRIQGNYPDCFKAESTTAAEDPRRRAEEETPGAAAEEARRLGQTTFRFPGAGIRNDNQRIGPFCCTGETAIVRRADGKPVGYIYYFDFKGGFTTSRNTMGVSSFGVLVSGLANLMDTWSAQQTGSVWFSPDNVEQKVRYTRAGSLNFRVTIERYSRGKRSGSGSYNFFNMGGVTVRVDVAVPRN